jgi:hypothetical protein
MTTISGIATGAYAPSSQPVQASSHQKHGKHHAQSMTDVDAQSSSIATAASPTGKIGSKVDISA